MSEIGSERIATIEVGKNELNRIRRNDMGGGITCRVGLE